MHPLHRFVAPGLLLAALASSLPGQSATITLGTDELGSTPEIVGYNLGHWAPQSNVADWWRYSGVTYARVFLPKKASEWKDDNRDTSLSDQNFGDGVTTLLQFTERRAAMRANPRAGFSSPAGTPRHLRSPFANWTHFEERLKAPLSSGSLNQMTPNEMFGELTDRGVDVLVQLTASWSANQPASWNGNMENNFPTASASDWAGYWELWQHYYVVASLLAEKFGISRYSVFNEPNHAAANGITPDEWLRRVRITSDAIQSAIADYNLARPVGAAALTPTIYAPTTTVALGTVYPTWGEPALQNRRHRYDGTIDPGWANFHAYSYQPYGRNISQYVFQISNLRVEIAEEVGTSPRMPIANTEFGVLHNSDMQGTTATLDSPELFVDFARILHQLQEIQPGKDGYGIDHMYLYKFGQTSAADPTDYPLNKLGTHYVQNAAGSGHNYGGITRAGEIYRLFNRAVAWRDPAQPVKRRAVSTTLPSVSVFATYDPVEQMHHVFSVNHGLSAAAVSYDVSALGLQHENRVVIQEVGTGWHGGVRAITRVANGVVAPPSVLQPPQSVWLASIPARPQSFRWPEGHPLRSFTATGDVTVRDGVHRGANFATENTLRVRNNGATAEGREIAVLSFTIPASELAQLSQAVLTFHAAASAPGVTAQAHVYGFSDTAFSEATATWSSQVALRQNHPAGALIAHNVVLNHTPPEVLNSTTPPKPLATFLGQVVATSTTAEEKRIDVTQFVADHVGKNLSFYIVQDNRWDTDQQNKNRPSDGGPNVVVLDGGDTQPAGLDIASRHAANSPRLRITRY